MPRNWRLRARISTSSVITSVISARATCATSSAARAAVRTSDTSALIPGLPVISA
jgi:hypothetical protein